MPASRLKRITYRLRQSLLEDGFSQTYLRVRRKLRSRFGAKAFKKAWKISKQKRKHQAERVFQDGVLISILVPLYNTPLYLLNEMLDSVQTQSCRQFELCLADGSDESHNEVGEAVKLRAETDARIRYQKLIKNEGISGNTNACIAMAKGTHFLLLDHDDLLHPSAVYEVMSVIDETGADLIYTDEATFRKHPRDAYLPHFKQDFSPDTLRAHNYICHITAFSRELLGEAGAFRNAFDGSQDFDLVLRLSEKAKKIVHIPRILYYWRNHQASVASDVSAKPYVVEAAKAAIRDHLQRVGLEGTVTDTLLPSIYRIQYKVQEEALVSILIPTCDHADDLKRCVDSILRLTDYANYEILLIENNSREAATFAYYETLKNERRVKLLTWPHGFNYSAINNFGASNANGKYLLLLNNDTEVISPGWIREMLMFAQRGDVGAVGAKLYYPNGTVQHAGIGLGLLTLAGHFHKGFPRNSLGYMGRLQYQQNVSAVTGACLMIKAEMYRAVGGMEEKLAVNFNDVDLCLRLREKGLLNVFTPFAELYHYESLSRGLDVAPEKRKRYLQEEAFFRGRWAKQLQAGDPYLGPNFDLLREDFSFR